MLNCCSSTLCTLYKQQNNCNKTMTKISDVPLHCKLVVMAFTQQCEYIISAFYNKEQRKTQCYLVSEVTLNTSNYGTYQLKIVR